VLGERNLTFCVSHVSAVYETSDVEEELRQVSRPDLEAQTGLAEYSFGLDRLAQCGGTAGSAAGAPSLMSGSHPCGSVASAASDARTLDSWQASYFKS
jgi:hypothetical protein